MKIIPTIIEPRASNVDLPYPEGEPANLKLDIPFGKVMLTPTTSTSIVKGRVIYNIKECKPSYKVKNRTVRVRQKYHGLTWDARNRWEMEIGTAQPLNLEVGIGAAQSEMDLSGVPLLGLKVNSGAGELTMSFDEPNPETMIEGRVQTGAGKTEIKGLLNANAQRFRVTAGVGQLIVHLTGDAVTTDGTLKIDGSMGEVVVKLDPSAPVRIAASAGLGSVHMDRALQQVKKGYQTASYEDAENHLNVDISTGLGAIRVEVVKAASETVKVKVSEQPAPPVDEVIEEVVEEEAPETPEEDAPAEE
jgi:hypothetical protein